MKPPVPANESARLQDLRNYQILDTGLEAPYDDITLIASHITNAPIAMVSLVDENRQWFKSQVGLDFQETPRDVALCAYAINDPGGIFIIGDATADDRTRDNPLVVGYPQIRFYAGAPLVTPAGTALGALCVIDQVPRELTADQQAALAALSRQVMSLLEMRRVARNLKREMDLREQYAVQLEHANKRLEELNARLEKETITDELTRLLNRRALDARLEEELGRSVRYGDPVSLALLDLDHFKAYNDTYGHPAGDIVLVSLGQMLRRECRQGDFPARYGGEEFAIVLPNTNAESAVMVTERIRAAIERGPWPNQGITASVGVATTSRQTTGPQAILEAADKALYTAKRTGRNRVVHADSGGAMAGSGAP